MDVIKALSFIYLKLKENNQINEEDYEDSFVKLQKILYLTELMCIILFYKPLLKGAKWVCLKSGPAIKKDYLDCTKSKFINAYKNLKVEELDTLNICLKQWMLKAPIEQLISIMHRDSYEIPLEAWKKITSTTYYGHQFISYEMLCRDAEILKNYIFKKSIPLLERVLSNGIKGRDIIKNEALKIIDYQKQLPINIEKLIKDFDFILSYEHLKGRYIAGIGIIKEDRCIIRVNEDGTLKERRYIASFILASILLYKTYFLDNWGRGELHIVWEESKEKFGTNMPLPYFSEQASNLAREILIPSCILANFLSIKTSKKRNIDYSMLSNKFLVPTNEVSSQIEFFYENFADKESYTML